jgi:hypothetical protein
VVCGMPVEVRFEEHSADDGDIAFVPVFAPVT